ncbi:MAG: hypothetical protein ACRBBR_10200 [Cellvibrionaceae bacterium]
MNVIFRFLSRRYICIMLACLTINHAYAENTQLVKGGQTEYKISPHISSQAFLHKMKRLSPKTFPGKAVSFRQLPTKAQREIKRSFDLQARRQTQACASQKHSINNFANATRGGTALECAIGEIAIGCWHGDDKFTGCQLLGDEWSCQWNETDPQGC